MKASTTVCYRFESVGRPDNTFEGEDTIRGVCMRIAAWLTAVPMGSKIRIILARDMSELTERRRSAASTDMMQELESILADNHNESEHDVCMDVLCPNEEPHEQGSADCLSRKQGDS